MKKPAAAPAPLDIERARDLIAKSTSIDELVDMRSKAKAIEVYQRARRAGEETAAAASCLAVEAERRLGELLAAMPSAPRGGDKRSASSKIKGAQKEPLVGAPTLAELGISNKDSARYQRLAAIPAAAFKDTIEAHRTAKKPVTSRAVLVAHAPASAGTTKGRPPPTSADAERVVVDLQQRIVRAIKTWPDAESLFPLEWALAMGLLELERQLEVAHRVGPVTHARAIEACVYRLVDCAAQAFAADAGEDVHVFQRDLSLETLFCRVEREGRAAVLAAWRAKWPEDFGGRT